jgi:hypothetical protein
MKQIMKKWLLLAPLFLTLACDDDPNTPGIQTICATPAPNLAGTWRGTLQNQQLSVMVTETCAVFIGGRTWWIEGGWTWNGSSGTLLGFTGTDLVSLSLVTTGPLPPPRSSVSLNFVLQVPLTVNVMTGKAGGVWRLPTDTTQIVASFDSVAITLTRSP